jgi:hypothetical protein
LTVSGGRNLEVRHEGVVRLDFDLVDECLEEGLLGLVVTVGDDLRDLIP